MSRMKDLAIEAAAHDETRDECSVCGHLPPSTPPCYEWERMATPTAHREAPEPIPAPNDPPVLPPWHGC